MLKGFTARVSRGHRKPLLDPLDITAVVQNMSPDDLENAQRVAERYSFRVPRFYAENVLTGRADDPLLGIVFPSLDELSDGDELWDATESPYRVSNSPFWIQKYEYQGLIRLTSICSGLCRFCYLKKKNDTLRIPSLADLSQLFDDLERNGSGLKEIILSGGDPLCAPSDHIHYLADRMERLRKLRSKDAPHITIHTREPVWDPDKLCRRSSLLDALGRMQPKTYMIHVLHPREVTDGFRKACSALSEAGGPLGRPALLCQHGLFRGVNDDVAILDELYRKLLNSSPPVLPYYLIHPFYNGTLPKHRLSVAESQAIYRELLRRPGCMTPRLVIPTPRGKCIIGPWEKFPEKPDEFFSYTKDGSTVSLGVPL